ncbi:hypothetical protein MTR67_012003, partial [Solanum verrucosum]
STHHLFGSPATTVGFSFLGMGTDSELVSLSDEAACSFWLDPVADLALDPEAWADSNPEAWLDSNLEEWVDSEPDAYPVAELQAA